MRSLLDINFIIALFDPDHSFHERAHDWWALHGKEGWASCPLTENGVIRIMSNPGYSRMMQFSQGNLIDRLEQFADQTDHEFWGGTISLRDESIFARSFMHSSRQLTDIYLLALAVAHDAKLVTFDERIPISAVHHAGKENLCIV